MRKIFTLLFIISITIAFSQTKNFSLEINYPLEFSNGNSSDLTGIINSKVKYRFLNRESFNIGASYSIDLLTGELIFQNQSESFTSHHFNLFGEIPLNSIKGLMPFLGVGYSTQSYFKTTNIYSDAGPVIPILKKIMLEGLI